jgi:hypothetical protein
MPLARSTTERTDAAAVSPRGSTLREFSERTRSTVPRGNRARADRTAAPGLRSGTPRGVSVDATDVGGRAAGRTAAPHTAVRAQRFLLRCCPLKLAGGSRQSTAVTGCRPASVLNTCRSSATPPGCRALPGPRRRRASSCPSMHLAWTRSSISTEWPAHSATYGAGTPPLSQVETHACRSEYGVASRGLASTSAVNVARPAARHTRM